MYALIKQIVHFPRIVGPEAAFVMMSVINPVEKEVKPELRLTIEVLLLLDRSTTASAGINSDKKSNARPPSRKEPNLKNLGNCDSSVGARQAQKALSCFINFLSGWQ